MATRFKWNMRGLTGKDRDAANALIEVFRRYGLESLAPRIIGYVKKGFGEDTIYMMLQSEPEFHKRFGGNERREKSGLPRLSIPEYLAAEKSYREIMHAAGLPKGFYDSIEDFETFIWKEVSPAELQARVQVAQDWATNTDKHARDFLQKNYGIGSIGELTAYAINPDRALPLIQKIQKAIKIGGAAARRGFGVSKVWTESLADIGVTGEQAEQGYSQVAEMVPAYSELGNVYGQKYGQKEAEEEVFLGSATATKKRKGLASQERATFGGSSRGKVGKATSGY